MFSSQEDPISAPRFKRRKIAHPRRAPTKEDDALSTPASESAPLPTSAAIDTPIAAEGSPTPALSAVPVNGDDEQTLNLKEILRQRKRPQDWLREAARRAEERKALMHRGAPSTSPLDRFDGHAEETGALERRNPYVDRFVAQTGQVVDQDDEGMTAYVEARLAEKNHRLYGWPIPEQLKRYLSADGPADRAMTSLSPPAGQVPASGSGLGDKKAGQDTRLAAGLGKLQEIDLGPEAMARNLQRIEEARRKAEGLPPALLPESAQAGNQKAGKPGKKPPRRQQRRNSEDLRRDLLVEAVLREAKIDYFSEDAQPTPLSNTDIADTDEALYEQFLRDYENQEQQRNMQRKPPAPQKDAKEGGMKGPKLGGSRTARAAMLKAQEEGKKG